MGKKSRTVVNARAGLRLVERFLIGGFLLVSSCGKIKQSPSQRIQDVEWYKLLPRNLVPPVSVALPMLEAGLGAAILVRSRPARSALASGGLMIGFSAAMQSALWRNIVTDCGCFGSLSRSQVSEKLVVRNLILAIFAFDLSAANFGAER